MRKITLNRKNTIILAVIGIIIAWLLQDGVAVKWISAIFVFITAFLMIMNLEKTGWLNLVSDAGPILLKAVDPYLSNTDLVQKITKEANTVLNQLGSSTQIDQKTCFSFLFYALFAIVLLLANKKDNTAMGISTKKVDSDRMRQTQTLCVTLKNRLAALNREEDWNENNFVPIEAQVEMTINGKHKRRRADLLTCLKRNRSFFSLRKLWNRIRRKQQKIVFLVLGDPGSGKSVALRKLCIDLMDETKVTNRVPVYINLKKWNQEWTITNLPKTQDLIEFIRNTLKGENPDSFTDSFLDNYFQDMLDNGQWYFIFDSFDELPCLMGAGNNRELVKKISELLHDFLVSGKQNGGIIASRYYKAPSEELEAEVTLRIREFDDVRIKKMMHIYLKQAYDVTDKLFREREDLVVLCRNPFYLSLLISYIQIWGTQLPNNQMELYDKFLKGRLDKHKGILDDAELNEDDVFRAAEKLALLMQESKDYGLECPVKEIHEKMGGQELCDKYLSALEYIKLCRRGGNKDTVSFVHRRFQEYLLVKSIRDDKIKIDYTECICSNSGLRDALALYCEVADEAKTKEIADFCWDTVKKKIDCKNTLDKPGSMILVNTLYFMVDAFRNRREAIANFAQEFEAFIEDNMNDETHFIIQLAMANSIALFDQESDNLPKTVLRIFKLKNHYLIDVVMHNCRLIKRMNSEVERKLVSYVNYQRIGNFLRRFSNTDFALSKAKGFGYVRIVHFLRLLRLIFITVMLLFDFAIIIANWRLLIERFFYSSFVSKYLIAVSIVVSTQVLVLWCRSQIKNHSTYDINSRFLLLLIIKMAILFVSSLCLILSILFIRLIILFLMILIIITELVGIFRYVTVFLGMIRCAIVKMVQFLSENSVRSIFVDFFRIMANIICKKFKEITITKVIVFVIPIVITFIMGKFDLTIMEVVMKYTGYILGFAFLIIVLSMLCRIVCLSIIDRVHISRYSFPLRIKKSELANNYDKLHTDKYKLIYLNRLLERHTQLVEDWPPYWKECGVRRKLKNGDLESTIAKLEYENMTTESQSYNAMIW